MMPPVPPQARGPDRPAPPSSWPGARAEAPLPAPKMDVGKPPAESREPRIPEAHLRSSINRHELIV